ncbi:MAG: tyrosine-type recombinase/integrase [Lachnospiraceae bacterium]|nr:tyrosine-type recombinase/integrase [Lachnospiraceae bacterium]MBR4059167.1 tyrosine-type recombinase/integrase [Lachnospiraceae bacterium]
MTDKILSEEHLNAFQEYLQREEKSAATVEKYLRDVRAFVAFAEGRSITKEVTIAFKKELEERQYAVRSINSMLASLNSMMEFMGWSDCKVKTLRCQRQIYCAVEKELTKAEYMRLLEASKKQEQLNLVMQTICGTGIRVSELKYFTVEAVRRGEVSVHCKSKIRTILVPGKLKRLLLDYAAKKNITSGAIFVSRNGKPLNRSNIWAQMKRLCQAARVNSEKVFPHNLRKLFARTFYGIEKDIAKLADILGHGSIETTRIYIMSTGTEHRRKIERLGLVV